MSSERRKELEHMRKSETQILIIGISHRNYAYEVAACYPFKVIYIYILVATPKGASILFDLW